MDGGSRSAARDSFATVHRSIGCTRCASISSTDNFPRSNRSINADVFGWLVAGDTSFSRFSISECIISETAFSPTKARRYPFRNLVKSEKNDIVHEGRSGGCIPRESHSPMFRDHLVLGFPCSCCCLKLL